MSGEPALSDGGDGSVICACNLFTHSTARGSRDLRVRVSRETIAVCVARNCVVTPNTRLSNAARQDTDTRLSST